MVKSSMLQAFRVWRTLTEKWHVRTEYITIKGKNMESGHHEYVCFLLLGLSLGSLSNDNSDGNDNVKKKKKRKK